MQFHIIIVSPENRYKNVNHILNFNSAPSCCHESQYVGTCLFVWFWGLNFCYAWKYSILCRVLHFDLWKVNFTFCKEKYHVYFKLILSYLSSTNSLQVSLVTFILHCSWIVNTSTWQIAGYELSIMPKGVLG